MYDIQSLSDDQFEALTDRVLNMYEVLTQEALPQSDSECYERLYRLSNDDDYELGIAIRNLSEDDDYDPDIGTEDEIIVASVFMQAKDGSLKNDVKVVDIIFNIDPHSDSPVSAFWFPEEL